MMKTNGERKMRVKDEEYEAQNATVRGAEQTQIELLVLT